MNWRNSIFIALLSLASSVAAAGLLTVEEPTTIEMSSEAARMWGRCRDEHPRALSSGISVIADGPLPVPLRVDLIEKVPGAWRLRQTIEVSTPVIPVLPPRGHVAVLLRTCDGKEPYWWADVDAAHATAPLRVAACKTIRVEPEDIDVRLFVDGEDEPRELDSRSHRFERVPVRDALMCAAAPNGARCATIAAAEVQRASEDVGSDLRVLRVDRAATLRVLEPGISVARPRVLTPVMQRAGAWVALRLPPGKPWNSVVLDWKAPSNALVRLRGRDLMPYPSFQIVPAGSEPGLRVIAVIGENDEAVTDPEVTLLFLPTREPEILLAAAHMENGEFLARELGAGEYRLKLLAAAALSAPVVRTLRTSLETVRFAAAPQIRGRVILASSMRADLVRVEVMRGSRLRSDEPRDSPADPVDSMREVAIAPDGTFRVGVPGAGTYTLNIVAGNARTERVVDVHPGDAVTDVGDISLSPGTTLRGAVAVCGNGELVLTPLPDLDAAPGVPFFFDLRRIQLGADGSFVADGMHAGGWLASAHCGGKTVDLVPSPFQLSSQDVSILDFAPR